MPDKIKIMSPSVKCRLPRQAETRKSQKSKKNFHVASLSSWPFWSKSLKPPLLQFAATVAAKTGLKRVRCSFGQFQSFVQM